MRTSSTESRRDVLRCTHQPALCQGCSRDTSGRGASMDSSVWGVEGYQQMLCEFDIQPQQACMPTNQACVRRLPARRARRRCCAQPVWKGVCSIKLQEGGEKDRERAWQVVKAVQPAAGSYYCGTPLRLPHAAHNMGAPHTSCTCKLQMAHTCQLHCSTPYRSVQPTCRRPHPPGSLQTCVVQYNTHNRTVPYKTVTHLPSDSSTRATEAQRGMPTASAALTRDVNQVLVGCRSAGSPAGGLRGNRHLHVSAHA